MDESDKVWKPKEGPNTPVSQVALLQIDRIIQQAREIRAVGHSEKEALELVNGHRDLDRISRSNVTDSPRVSVPRTTLRWKMCSK